MLNPASEKRSAGTTRPKYWGGLACLGAAMLSVAGEAWGEPPPDPAPTQAAPVTPEPDTAGEPTGVALLKRERLRLKGVLISDLARQFLAGIDLLPSIETRLVLRTRDRSAAYTPEQAHTLDEAQRKDLIEKACDEQFYYFTGYGSPLVYARVLDVLELHGVKSLDGAKLMDFGCGTIGHLRLLGSMGCHAHGVDVEPVFKALYREATDVGDMPRNDPRKSHLPGSVHLHIGLWPGESAIRAGVGVGYDVITSKNTLKRGYIHPEREVDERFLVRLGVSDEQFVKALHDALKPGGVLVIYNIAPGQNPPDKPYLPHSDGRCPFPRELLEHTGFEVLAYDLNDAPKIHRMWRELGYDEGRGEEWLKENVFVMYTLAMRPRTEPGGEKPAP